MPRIELLSHEDDGRALKIEKALKSRGVQASVRVADIYTVEEEQAASPAFIASLQNPVIQSVLQHPLSHPFPRRGEGKGGGEDASDLKFNWALEIGFLPGVTDNVGHTAEEMLQLLDAGNDNRCYSSRLYLIKGNATKEDIEALAATLANPLIQRIHIKDLERYKKDGGMDEVIPKVVLDNKGAAADEVNLDVSDEDLEVIGKEGIANADGSRRGPLGMSLLYMKAVQDYFKKEGRKARDIELETLAQTWSEHCKHTIFASPIDEVKDGIYKHYIKRATREIREKRRQKLSSRTPKAEGSHDNQGDSSSQAPRNDSVTWNDNGTVEGDICVSVFSDNAGGIIFDENYLITDKVETHNSPSALDPFGGAITGIVGVNRDCIGFGRGAKPVINRYGYCFAPVPTQQRHSRLRGNDGKFKYFRDKDLKIPILSPETIMNGVVQGVESGGNCSGIPTPQGFAYFDERYIGKPLVFVGTVGLIPRDINGKPGHEKKALPGDKIVMVGGRIGRDGIHGATFSSVELDEGSPVTAVQIGDPITQKKFSDAIVKELRDKGWYNAITDNGAGGLSSSVGEMAEQSGGFHVELEKAPLKYPGMAPWEIWISESQERMTLAVPPENTGKLIEFLARRGVEATVIGEYTNSGRAQVSWQGEMIMDLDMDFLHDGLPETPLKTTFTPGGEDEPSLPEPDDYESLLCAMLSRLNICSKEFIAAQYDHNVQGGAVLGPLQGPGRVYAEATVTKPVLNSPRGVVLSQGIAPRYSDIDTFHMAAASLDMAVRNAVTAGADVNHLAILDNFCWCSSDEPERLGQLKRAAEAIYDLAVLYETPFISGKDSMFNDFKGYDADGKVVKISVPPTLLVSAIGVIPDVQQAISLASKAPGDLVYLLGETEDECGASEYYDHLGHLGKNVPHTNGKRNVLLYKIYSQAARKGLIASAMPVNFGGLGAALAKMAIAGQAGLDIDLSSIDLRADKALFSESTGRIIVTVAPQNVKAFEKHFKKFRHIQQIGSVAYSDKLHIRNVLELGVEALETAYKTPLNTY